MSDAIASLLRRAKAAAAAISTMEVVAAWPTAGAAVELLVPTRIGDAPTGLRGRVAFDDGDWIYWAAEDGHVHASRRGALRRL